MAFNDSAVSIGVDQRFRSWKSRELAEQPVVPVLFVQELMEYDIPLLVSDIYRTNPTTQSSQKARHVLIY